MCPVRITPFCEQTTTVSPAKRNGRPQGGGHTYAAKGVLGNFALYCVRKQVNTKMKKEKPKSFTVIYSHG